MRILFKDSNQVAMLPVIFFFLLFKASLFGSLFYGFNRESSRYLYLTKYLQPLRFWCCNTVSVECQLHSKMLAEKWTDLVLCARVRWISSRCAVMCCCFDAITRREHGNILQPVQIMFLWNWRQCGEAGTSKRRKNCVCSSRLGYKICTVNVYYVWNMRQYLHSHVSIFIVITFFLLFAHILLTFIFFCCVCAAPFGSAIRCKDVRTCYTRTQSVNAYFFLCCHWVWSEMVTTATMVGILWHPSSIMSQWFFFLFRFSWHRISYPLLFKFRRVMEGTTRWENMEG